MRESFFESKKIWEPVLQQPYESLEIHVLAKSWPNITRFCESPLPSFQSCKYPADMVDTNVETVRVRAEDDIKWVIKVKETLLLLAKCDF